MFLRSCEHLPHLFRERLLHLFRERLPSFRFAIPAVVRAGRPIIAVARAGRLIAVVREGRHSGARALQGAEALPTS